jgi:hypothetical protein
MTQAHDSNIHASSQRNQFVIRQIKILVSSAKLKTKRCFAYLLAFLKVKKNGALAQGNSTKIYQIQAFNRAV